MLRIACRHPARLLAGAVALAVLTAACLPPTGRGSPAATTGATGSDPVSAEPSIPVAPTARPPFVPPTPTPAPTFLVYTVASGDNLNSIAKKFGTSARSIAYWNRSTYPSLDPESPGYRPNLLKLGWTLFLIPNLIVTGDDVPPLPTSGDPDETATDDGTDDPAP